MPVFRWGNALDAFRDLEREMDRWMRSMAFEGLRLGRPYPALNLYELENEYLLTAEISGCDGADLDISVANGVLILKGTRYSMADLSGGVIPEDRFRRSERPFGNWHRELALPERVNDESIRAELTDGLLRLHLPKLPTSAPRKIQVNNSRRIEGSTGGSPHVE